MSIAMALSLLGAAAAPAPAGPPEEITAPGPQGALHGTLIPPAPDRPLLLILPGSGPTDRDGNSPLGIRAGTYRMLAEALAARGIGTARIDKRGLGASAGAVADGNAVTIGDYVTDTRAWIASLRAKTGRACIWLAGHSEGGLIALAAAQQPEGICGIILVAAPGRPLGTILREQLRANPANAPLLPQAMAAIDRLEAGERVDAGTLPPALQRLFAPQVQGFLIDAMAYDPAALAGKVALSMLILQGEADLQVSLADAQALHAARPAATLALLPGVNHVLKAVPAGDRAANFARYGDASAPLAPAVVDAMAAFVTQAETGKE